MDGKVWTIYSKKLNLKKDPELTLQTKTLSLLIAELPIVMPIFLLT